jgi:hypothetical protein
MAPTSAKLKHDIDRGRGGDKVDVIDSAAAPLGTDDEAAGAAPSIDAIAQAHRDEIAETRVTSERNDKDHAVAIYVAVIVSITTVIGLAIWLTQGGAMSSD